MGSQIPPGADLSKIPSAPLPPGVLAPQFDNPPTALTGTLIGISAFLISWGVLFAAIRLWVNRRKLGIADAFVATAVVLSVAYCGILLSFAPYFRHAYDMPLSWYTPLYMKQLYAQGMLLGPTIFFAKEAIFLMYFEVFQVKPWMRVAIIVGMIFTGLAYLPGVILDTIFCAARPGETWDPLLGAKITGRCDKMIYWGIVQGSCAILIDIYIFVLPIQPIVQLQLGLKRKIQILAVFMMAFLGIVASVFAQVYRVKLHTEPAETQFVQSQQLICVIVENWVAVIVSCMPTFAAFLRVYVGESQFYQSLQSKLFSSHGTSASGSKIPSASMYGKRAAVVTIGGSTDSDGSYYKLGGSRSKAASDVELTSFRG